MREKILEIIENSDKSLNITEIVNIVKPINTVEDYKEISSIVEELCQEGLIRLTNNNGYVKNELLYGVIDEHAKGNAHVLVKNEEDIFINRLHMNGARDKDVVLVDYTNREKHEGKVVRILKRSLGRGLGEVVNNNGKFSIRMLDDLPYLVEIDDIENTGFNLVDGLIVHLDYIRDISKGQVMAKIDYVVGHKNAAGMDTPIAIIASEFGRRLDFPKEVLEEAKQFKTYLTQEEVLEGLESGRVDLRGETITTIDGKDTKDIDDAVNTVILPNGNFLVTVAIADVSHYVKMGSEIWKYAEFKGNSDYLGNKVGPMLPIELSNGICSLNPNEDRFALTVQFELTPGGEKTNIDVFTSVIKSKQKMNYDAVQDIIDSKYTEDTKDYTTLKYTVKDNEDIEKIAFKYNITVDELLKVNKDTEFKHGNEVNIPTRKVVLNNYLASRIMKSALKRRGKVNFDGREPKNYFDENDKIIDIKPRIQRPAEELIENMMIYANEAFASFMVNKLSEIFTARTPFVYRTHEEPNPLKVQDFINMLNAYGIVLPYNIDPENVSSHDLEMILETLKDKNNYSAFSDKLLRCMQKAKYTPVNYGHFGIASDLYCHYTSPIRRMADLLVHTMFKVFIVEKKYDIDTLKFWGNYLDEICERISLCEQEAEKCEYAVQDYINALYLEDKMGSTFEANIDGIMNGSFFARTDNYIDGKVDFYLEEIDARDFMKLESDEERYQFIEEHKKTIATHLDFNEKLYGYSKNGRMYLRYGDRILVVCNGAYPERREVNFTLVRKL